MLDVIASPESGYTVSYPKAVVHHAKIYFRPLEQDPGPSLKGAPSFLFTLPLITPFFVLFFFFLIQTLLYEKKISKEKKKKKKRIHVCLNK